MDEQELRRRRARTDEAEETELQQWRETHRSLSDRVERFLMQVVILGLVGLVLVQTLMVSPAIRRVANLMEGSEGIAVNADPAWQAVATNSTLAPVKNTEPQAVAAGARPAELTITVFLVTKRSEPRARLLVAGRSVGDFRTGVVTAKVTPGQVVAVDATEVPESLTFRVIGSRDLASPALGSEVTTIAGKPELGTVKRAASSH